MLGNGKGHGSRKRYTETSGRVFSPHVKRWDTLNTPSSLLLGEDLGPSTPRRAKVNDGEPTDGSGILYESERTTSCSLGTESQITGVSSGRVGSVVGRLWIDWDLSVCDVRK